MASSPIRIGVDARAAAEVPAGRGRYVRELLRAMSALDGDHELILYGREPWPLAGSRWRLIRSPDPVWPLHVAHTAGGTCDVMLATGSYLLCASAPLPTAATVFDLVAFDPELRPPHGALAERLTLPLAVRRAASLLCISEATRAELLARFPAARERAHVIPLGVDREFAEAGSQKDPNASEPARPYVLSVGTLEPRKNLVRLVDAYARLPESLRDRFELVLVGGRGWATSEIDAALERHAAHVRVLGAVTDAELRALYAGASVFAYPSLAEGFGLPVLEAMAAGAPVLTSNRSSLVEVAGEAAELVDPFDVASITKGLSALLADQARRSDLAARGRLRAAEFTWERTARQTLDHLIDVVS
jgi:glycosyltransferase involved in cell wall biosynthesis